MILKLYRTIQKNLNSHCLFFSPVSIPLSHALFWTFSESTCLTVRFQETIAFMKGKTKLIRHVAIAFPLHHDLCVYTGFSTNIPFFIYILFYMEERVSLYQPRNLGQKVELFHCCYSSNKEPYLVLFPHKKDHRACT